MVQSGEVVASAWMDNKVVTAMWTGYCSNKTTVQRVEKTGSKITVQCPAGIASYNTNMGGVDRGDQLRGYYRRHTKSRKFYR